MNDLTPEQRNRAAVHKAMEIIVENEITGVSEWRYNLTDRLTEAALSALPDEDVWKMLDGDAAWADQLTGEHVPHYGNHQHYACGFSGTHCWKCGEPWPCRTERGVTRGPARLAAALARSESPSPEGLTEAIAEGLHKAMCYGPTTLHNRLACERPQVYLALAEAAVAASGGRAPGERAGVYVDRQQVHDLIDRMLR